MVDHSSSRKWGSGPVRRPQGDCLRSGRLREGTGAAAQDTTCGPAHLNDLVHAQGSQGILWQAIKKIQEASGKPDARQSGTPEESKAAKAFARGLPRAINYLWTSSSRTRTL